MVLTVERALDADELRFRMLETYMRRSHMLEGDRSCCVVESLWTKKLVLFVMLVS